jgi:hypothetical protein
LASSWRPIILEALHAPTFDVLKEELNVLWRLDAPAFTAGEGGLGLIDRSEDLSADLFHDSRLGAEKSYVKALSS